MLFALVVPLAVPTIATAAAASPQDSPASEFERRLETIDDALRRNPHFVAKQAIESCYDRRNTAQHLYLRGHEIRAIRSLTYCFHLLGVPEDAVKPPPDPDAAAKRQAARWAAITAQAGRESDEAERLTPNVARGLEIYRECAACHTPEGWGMQSGIVPQIAGQHRDVLIKQLADIRAGQRSNRLMVPYASVEAIGGPQAIADVAGYIDTLEISTANGRGPGKDLALGEKLYRENCVGCHGASGEGDNERRIPRIQAQHFNYLVTQFEEIRDGKRRNADPQMVAQIEGFADREIEAVMDYVSRLEPPPELVAPLDWRNPDFVKVLQAR
jgi:cytochrome c553